MKSELLHSEIPRSFWSDPLDQRTVGDTQVLKSGHCEVWSNGMASAAKQFEPKGALPWVCDELSPWCIAVGAA